MVNQRRGSRQQANRRMLNCSVKTGINKVFSDDALRQVIGRAVQLATPIEIQGQLLAQFHVIRILQLGQQPGPLNTTFFNRCYSAVSNPTAGSQPYNRDQDTALTASVDAFNAYVPAGHARPNRPAFLKDVLSEASQLAVSNAATHIGYQLEARSKRWIKTKLSGLAYFDNLPARNWASWAQLLWRAGTASQQQQQGILDLLPQFTSLPQVGSPHHPSPVTMAQLDNIVSVMHQHIPLRPVTEASLKRQPQAYLAWMFQMLQDLTPLAAQAQPFSKLFNLLPQKGNAANFIAISTASLHRFLNFINPMPAGVPNLSPASCKYFQLCRVRWWRRYSHCIPFCQQHKPGWDFEFRVVTDGVSASIRCTKPAGSSARPDTDTDSVPTDYVVPVAGQPQSADILQAPRMVGIDPGRKSPFTAVVHSDSAHNSLHAAQSEKYETFGCSAQQWHEDSGSHHRNSVTTRRMMAEPPLRQTLTDIPSAKVCTIADFGNHTRYRLQHLPTVLAHFTARRYKTLRWRSFIHKQSAMAQLVNRITDRDPSTVVAYGNADFAHNSKGTRSTPNTALKKALRPSCNLFAVDERNTSALCCACHHHMSGMYLPQGERGPRDGSYSYCVRLCNNTACPRMMWHRDVNAAINMLHLLRDWAASHPRPPEFG